MLMRTVVAALAAALLPLPSWAAMQLTPARGGPGGGEYRITCPIASYLIGFEVRVGYWLDQLEPICGLIDFDNPGNAAGSYRFKRVVDAMEPRVTGGSGGGLTETSCADLDQVVVAIELEIAHSDGDTYASNVFPICQRMGPPGDRREAHGARFGGKTDPTYENVGVLSCPQGQWAVGVHGASGIYIDSLGLVCDDAFRPGGVTKAPAPASPALVLVPQKTANKDPYLKALGALSHEFPAPTIDGAGVDVCLHWGSSCGAPAADEFCRRQGLTASLSSTVQNDAPPTLILGDNAMCKDPGCDRFSAISCK
jgi:hypothetical protein